MGWSFFVSEPVNPSAVNVAFADEPDDCRRPDVTVGNTYTLGLRGWAQNRDRGDRTDLEVFIELNATNVRDHEQSAGFFGATLGVRTRIGGDDDTGAIEPASAD
jgi:hypothetical protein